MEEPTVGTRLGRRHRSMPCDTYKVLIMLDFRQHKYLHISTVSQLVLGMWHSPHILAKMEALILQFSFSIVRYTQNDTG